MRLTITSCRICWMRRCPRDISKVAPNPWCDPSGRRPSTRNQLRLGHGQLENGWLSPLFSVSSRVLCGMLWWKHVETYSCNIHVDYDRFGSERYVCLPPLQTLYYSSRYYSRLEVCRNSADKKGRWIPLQVCSGCARDPKEFIEVALCWDRWSCICSVGGLDHFLFSHIFGIIIPVD